MRILVIKAMGDPQWGDIENNPEAMKQVVGGTELEIFPTLVRDVVIVADWDAKIYNKPCNFYTEKDIIAGDVFCVGMRGDAFVDITEDQARAMLAVYLPDSPSKSFYNKLFPEKE